MFPRKSKGGEASGYFMILLVGFLCYVVGIGLTYDAYQYVWFVLILLLLCLFDIVWMQVGDVSLDEDEEFSSSFYFSFRIVGVVSFHYYVMLYS